MSDTSLNSKALATLSTKGWDGSSREIENDLAELRYEGFDDPPNHVVSILRRYSGLEFDAVSEYTQSRLEISFGLEKVFEIPSVKKNIAEQEIILGKELYPIGSMDTHRLEKPSSSSSRLILFVAEDSNIYSSMPGFISQQAYNVEDFINRIIEDQPLWKNNDELRTSYSYYDPRLRELRKQELVEERLSRTR
jgi:hypothetical protein